MLERARAIYRQSKKRNDNLWTEWVSRPPAALVVQALEHSRVTPNQVSFASLAVFAAAAAVLATVLPWSGLLVAALLVQASYVLDCVDGQLARLANLSSPAGALLDFLVDEWKALLLVGAAAVRLWRQAALAPSLANPGGAWPAELWLLLGVAGLLVVASGLSLTTFLRRPEYREAVGAPPVAEATDRGGFLPSRWTPLSLLEAAGRLALHYPSWLPLVALLDRLDAFLLIYLGASALHLGRAGLSVLMALGRSRPRPLA